MLTSADRPRPGAHEGAPRGHRPAAIQEASAVTEPPPATAAHDPGEDPRFTFGLLLDVAHVLEAHGYPEHTSGDLVDLGQALYRYVTGRLYAEDVAGRHPSRPVPPAARPVASPRPARGRGRA